MATMAENETKLCNNCKKQISVSNFIMHEMHCRRHIALCEHCQEPIPKGEMSIHFEETHAKTKCPKCNVEIEKAHLEDHEENDCIKRPMKCIYCQLEFPKDALNPHLDYCGSRTEQCSKCLQYIKLKDQTKHEESNCQFPEVRPKNNNRSDFASGLSELNGGQHGMHSFAFDELSRVIGQRAVGEPSVPQRPSRIGESKTDNARPRLNRHVKVQNLSRPTVSKSNLNRKILTSKEVNSTKTPTPETDYDHLLAMHLAQDLNQEEGLDAVVKALEKPSPSTPPHQFDVFRDRNTFSEDFVLIPCEFCGEPFTSDDLVQHQSGCSLDRISEILPTLTPTLSNNSRKDVPISPTLVDPPSIINNLGPANAEWVDDTVNLVNDSADNMMLPCEFCAELFPIDSLIQHQAICDSNVSMTPRITTPVGARSSRTTQGLHSNHSLAEEFPNLSSCRHQSPPSFQLDSDSEDDTVARRTQPKYTFGAISHRVTKPNTKLGKNKDTSSSPTASLNSVLRKYGVESQDRGDHYYRRGSQHSRVTDKDTYLEPNAPIAKKRTGSAARTSDTLNGLLYEANESPSSHDLLAHIGGPKTRKNESNSTRQKAVIPPATRSVAKTRSTNTNAREVQRELSRFGASVSTQPPRNSRTNKTNIEVRVRPAAADEISEAVLTNQRSRAQVFGARNGKITTMRRNPDVK